MLNIKCVLSIFIVYSIASGMQGSDQPNPGQPYFAVGFPRVCYLPDNAQGRRVSVDVFVFRLDVFNQWFYLKSFGYNKRYLKIKTVKKSFWVCVISRLHKKKILVVL